MKLLVITDLSFPIGSAMASRIKSFCLLFNEIGYDIHVIAGKTGDHTLEYNKVYKDEKYSYEIVNSNRTEQIQSFIGNENLVNRVDEYLKNNEVDLVFFNSLGALFNKILAICNKYHIKTILEQCEWYDPSGFRFNKHDPRYIRFNNNLNNNFVKADGVICISSLLNDYYLSKNVNTIRIPSIFDVKNIKYNNELNNERIRLIYTGNIGKSKELLKPIINVLSNKKYENNILLDIYGINKNDVLKSTGSSTLPNNVSVHGRVPYKELENALLNSNYQIFIKPKRRSSNAQFPTKFAESMSYGTPVICNDTGDIKMYLKDSINGFICDENNIEKTFDEILNLSLEQYNKLRDNARKTAEECFDYRNYKKEIIKLIEKL